MNREDYTPASLQELREAVTHGRSRNALEIDSVPLELVGQLLELLDAADEASGLLEEGRAKAARRTLNRALNQIPAR